MFADLLIPYWFWLCLGGILLALEMLGTAGYLLWSGIAALGVGIINYFVPLSTHSQLLIFAIFTLLAVVCWWLYLQKKQRATPTQLNLRSQQLISLRATLDEAVINGVGRIRLGDSSWRVIAQQDLPLGQTVVIIGVDGNSLQVAAVDTLTTP